MAFESVKKFFNDSKTMASNELGKFKNAKFLGSLIAGSAYMAYADGSCQPEEKTKMMGFIRSYEPLKVFDINAVIAAWKVWENNYEKDMGKEFADVAALEAIGKMRGDEASSRMLIRLAILIANSDNNFEPSEVKAAVNICRELKLDPTDFGLTA